MDTTEQADDLRERYFRELGEWLAREQWSEERRQIAAVLRRTVDDLQASREIVRQLEPHARLRPGGGVVVAVDGKDMDVREAVAMVAACRSHG